MQKYILSLDAGTTSNRAILFNHSGEIVANKDFFSPVSIYYIV
jgi:glycerol kinase